MLLYFKDTAELEKVVRIETGQPKATPSGIARGLISEGAEAGRGKLDEAVRMAQALKGAEIDACACNTDRDWKVMHELAEKWTDFSADLTEVR